MEPIKQYISLKTITEAWSRTKQFWDSTVRKPKQMNTTMVYLYIAGDVCYTAPYNTENRLNTNTQACCLFLQLAMSYQCLEKDSVSEKIYTKRLIQVPICRSL